MYMYTDTTIVVIDHHILSRFSSFNEYRRNNYL